MYVLLFSFLRCYFGCSMLGKYVGYPDTNRYLEQNYLHNRWTFSQEAFDGWMQRSEFSALLMKSSVLCIENSLCVGNVYLTSPFAYWSLPDLQILNHVQVCVIWITLFQTCMSEAICSPKSEHKSTKIYCPTRQINKPHSISGVQDVYYVWWLWRCIFPAIIIYI